MATAIFFSCSKDDNGENQQDGNVCRVSEWTDNDGTKTTLKYDSQGRVSEVTYDVNYDGSVQVRIVDEYSYYSNRIDFTRKVYSEEGGQAGDTHFSFYDLDASGRIVSHRAESYTADYSYSTDGYLIKVIEDGNDDEPIYLTWKSGNLESVRDSYYTTIGTGPKGLTTTFTYDITADYVRYKPLFYIEGVWEDGILSSEGYFGKLPKNQVTRKSSKSSTTESVTTYSYARDNAGNAVHIKGEYTSSWGNGTSKVELKYSNCK